MRKKIFADDFKAMVIEVYKTGKPVKEISEEYGVSTTTINNWVNRKQPTQKISKKPIVSTSKAKKQTKIDADNENKRLRKEIEKIQMENEILKKAIAIFSKDQEL